MGVKRGDRGDFESDRGDFGSYEGLRSGFSSSLNH